MPSVGATVWRSAAFASEKLSEPTNPAQSFLAGFSINRQSHPRRRRDANSERGDPSRKDYRDGKTKCRYLILAFLSYSYFLVHPLILSLFVRAY